MRGLAHLYLCGIAGRLEAFVKPTIYNYLSIYYNVKSLKGGDNGKKKKWHKGKRINQKGQS